MRLLKYGENEDLSIAEFDEDTKPPYAILSHRWGAEADEVTFEDVVENTGKNKPGYTKIRCCGKQAQRDGLQYFWVDTCCINKANKAELSLAIQSMFRWYRNSAQCYVYLSDEKLGDKRSLIQQVQEATGIPRLALQGASLSKFSINKRLRWIEHRRTTHLEDKVYSLLGVVDVDLALCYSEGVDGAFRRLHDEIDKTKQYLYRWVLHNDSFRQWHEDPQSRLLWIKGDPSKGKTMLLCGIIDELATAVLQGLLYMLVKQQPSLASHVRKKYDAAGKNIFEDANAWIPLVDIFTDVLRDLSLTTTYLIVDALDECVTNLPKLLDFIAKQSSASSCVKWIVSSRNWPEIEGRLEQAGHKVRLSLELNAASVSTAVQDFID
ncbi:HET-domain-containing protein [Decorospora gaudefroyi]|uniref:HET-domain-containing protein n=1 Tax=Decorospora gaudefroyi TaxID=184978 RepID=A0A6A5K2P5_9PLEO|nr:HET-domain-containing protein [Decorospora gaudefroyi]